MKPTDPPSPIDASITPFGLMRHAPTEWNREKRLQGQNDSPLLTESEALAREWGRRLSPLGWERILASDLGRARRTAELVNQTLNLPLEVDARLREIDWGRWTGLRLNDLAAVDPKQFSNLDSEGCEDRLEAWRRSREALREAGNRWPGRRILVVTHFGIIKCLIYRLTRRRFVPDEPALLRPAHLHRIRCRAGWLDVEAVNAVSLNGNSP
ncbi:MAG: histidine phosphatase family protein [Desulfococcaceae bacterium]